jgi:hypothetical protein
MSKILEPLPQSDIGQEEDIARFDDQPMEIRSESPDEVGGDGRILWVGSSQPRNASSSRDKESAAFIPGRVMT